jgi:hypothetical protein
MMLLSEREAALESPLAKRAVRSQFVSLDEVERDAVRVYYSSLTKRALISCLVVLIFPAIMGYGAVQAGGIAMAPQFNVGGAAVLSVCALVLAYLIYDYRRKQRIFILEDAFAVERRFRLEVELVRWTDVAKLYCLDRTTRMTSYVYFVPVATTKVHHAKLRILLVDGREIVLTKRVRDFSAMATQFALRTQAAQLAPCVRHLIDGGALDFDKFSLTAGGLVQRGKLLPWNDIQRISLNAQGTLLFKTATRWRSPRFSTDRLPNAALLLELVSMFGAEVCQA